ncbi:MAG: peptide chain release factor N(5)-glutamine methyltransferase [Elainellaceae cyanobacterium]
MLNAVVSKYTASGNAVWQWRQRSRRQAIAHQVDPDEVDWVLLTVSDLDRLALRLETVQRRQTVALTLPLSTLAERWQQRMTQRSPVQYVTGKAPWRDFELLVSPAVLIPRPETERLIDLVQQATQAQPLLQRGNWADLGTGSGAIALGLATVLPDAAIYAVEYSPDALAIAQQNAKQHQLDARIQFYQGSWFGPLQPLRGQLGGMVSNPPYIPTGLLPQLDPEVQHDPQLALDGGDDGLEAMRQLVANAPDYLISGGIWLVETMMGQTDAVADLLDRGPYSNIRIFEDLAGVTRFVLAYRL